MRGGEAERDKQEEWCLMEWTVLGPSGIVHQWRGAPREIKKSGAGGHANTKGPKQRQIKRDYVKSVTRWSDKVEDNKEAT